MVVITQDNDGGFIHAGCDPCISTAGTAGSFGFCEPCRPGTAPNTAGTECIQCGFGEYSSDGVSCQACWPGEQPHCNAEIEWVADAVAATQVWEAHGAYAVGTAGYGCASCESCVDVVGASGYSSDGKQCLACGIGKQPNADRSGCDDCAAGEYSDGSGCSACGAGTQPSTDQGYCESCGFFGENKYSPGGVALCMDCGAGTAGKKLTIFT